ncbi:MAG: hypothetical protein AAF389_02250 [Gemmatimonadota bacterium]
MIRGLLSTETMAGIRRELDVEAVRLREIGHRVANASNDKTASFEGALDEAMAEGEVDLEAEMVALADAQLRYEVASQLLQETYAQIRATMRSA